MRGPELRARRPGAQSYLLSPLSALLSPPCSLLSPLFSLFSPLSSFRSPLSSLLSPLSSLRNHFPFAFGCPAASERKHGLSTERFPVSAYGGSSKNLKDLKRRNRNGRPGGPFCLRTKGRKLESFKDFYLKNGPSQGQNLPLTVLIVPNSLGSVSVSVWGYTPCRHSRGDFTQDTLVSPISIIEDTNRYCLKLDEMVSANMHGRREDHQVPTLPLIPNPTR